jgi:hypothetical protein
MTTEEINFKTNNELFVDRLKNASIHKIILLTDTEPEFDLDVVPFSFEYSFSAIVITNHGYYKIFPAATSSGFETFWTEEVEQAYNGYGKVQEINSIPDAVYFESEQGFDYPFKLTLQFVDKAIYLYCGEIYNDSDGRLKYNIYDEMILAFDNKTEARKFEQLINYG